MAEEVRLAFPRPLRAPQLVLIDVDPRHLHAFWTLDAASVDAARRASANTGDAVMVLRISGTGDGAEDAFDVEVAGLQGQCYVDIWGEMRSYRGELGLRRGDGSLDALAPAALVQLPSAGPAGRAPKVPAAAPTAAVFPAEVAQSVAVAAAPAAPTMPAAPPPAAHELPEPVRHPFPLPPTEGASTIRSRAQLHRKHPPAPRLRLRARRRRLRRPSPGRCRRRTNCPSRCAIRSRCRLLIPATMTRWR
ncbi:MAG: DUF4912 domain-containing protein [Rhodospirillales bacterium]